jgi:tRNA threonylcarbamoyladenosine biosynthesis protein TsaE
LINEYQGRLILYHVDAYRLEDYKQLENLGFDETCAAGGVVVIEWADRVWELVKDYEPIEIHLQHLGEIKRDIRIENISAEIKSKMSV